MNDWQFYSFSDMFSIDVQKQQLQTLALEHEH